MKHHNLSGQFINTVKCLRCVHPCIALFYLVTVFLVFVLAPYVVFLCCLNIKCSFTGSIEIFFFSTVQLYMSGLTLTSFNWTKHNVFPLFWSRCAPRYYSFTRLHASKIPLCEFGLSPFYPTWVFRPTFNVCCRCMINLMGNVRISHPQMQVEIMMFCKSHPLIFTNILTPRRTWKYTYTHLQSLTHSSSSD